MGIIRTIKVINIKVIKVDFFFDSIHLQQLAILATLGPFGA